MSKKNKKIKNVFGKKTFSDKHRKIIYKEIHKVREPVKRFLDKLPVKDKEKKIFADKYLKVGIHGFDMMIEKGVRRGSANLICGGPGTGKTIFGLQTLYYGAMQGEKCLYMSFEESEDRLLEAMAGFGFDLKKIPKEGELRIKRYRPFEIMKSVEALLMKEKGELLIDTHPVILPMDYKPQRIVVDSLSAIAATFMGQDEKYRIYLEELFLLLESSGVTSFLIMETEQIPAEHMVTRNGIAEFLADAVIILYYIRKGSLRERACEIIKIRGSKHLQKIVSMEITSKGIEIYPKQNIIL